MKFLHVNNENSSQLNEYIKKGTPIFLLIYMDGCGPCNSTKPEWSKIENVFKNMDRDVIVADIEQANLPSLDNLHYKVAGFPTMLFISNKGKNIQTIEENGFNERNIDTFVKWINHHIKSLSTQIHDVVKKITRQRSTPKHNPKLKPKTRQKRKTRQKHKTRQNHKTKRQRPILR